MSAVIQNEYIQEDTTTVLRNFTFPYLKTSDIKVSLDGVETTAFTLANATTIQFNSVPPNGAKIKIFRETSVDDLTATFYAGSAIKSEDLNDNFTQNLYKTQEVGARALNTLGGTMTGNLTLDTQADLVFEGATADAHETTIKVVDPTADRTITFPNVTGTVVTTGDTGTVATGMIATGAVTEPKIPSNAIIADKIASGAVTGTKLATNAVTTDKIADSNVTTGKLAADAVTNAKLADSAVRVENLDASSISTAKIQDDAVTGAKIADDAISNNHLSNPCVQTENINDNAITQAKMADDSVGTAELVDSSVVTAALADNSVTLAKMTDNSVGTSELVDAAVTTAKVANNGITTAKIADDAITNAKLANPCVQTENLTDSSVTNAKIQAGAVGATSIGSSAVTEAKIASDAVTTTKVADDAVTTAKIADSELKTLAGMQSGTASKLADSTALTADIADLNQIDGLTKQTTISDSDASFPTSGAVVDYVAAQIAPLGGLEVIATEVAFPNTQPSSGVVISISDAGGVVFNGSGTSTTGRTVGGSTVTINNAPSSLNNETLAAGVGLMVSSTGSSQTYNYHKILGKEEDIKQLSDDINDFAARYRVGSSNPTSALDGGDLFFNTTTGKLLVYNNTTTAWEEAQSIGNFFISTLSPAFDGSTQNFTLSNAPTNAQQLLLSINGVIQKPNAGTSTPSEGFALDGSTVKLSAIPANGDTYFAVVMGSTVNIGTPSNNTVTTAILQNGAVTTAKIGDDQVTQAKLAINSVGSQEIIPNNVITTSINDGAVTEGKIASNAVNTAKIVDGSVTGPKIADATIALSKLAHGTSSNDGKFLRANNGADPTFETVNTDLVSDTSPQLGGDLDANGHNIKIGDGEELRIGDGNDLIIKHDSANTYLSNQTGELVLNGDTIRLRKGDGLEDHLKCFANGSVELYQNGTKRFETNSVGAQVIGTFSVDATTGLGLPIGTNANEPNAANYKGYVRYNDDQDVVYFSNGSSWQKISATIASLTSITGSIVAGIGSNLTLAGTGFLSSNLVVNFVQSSDSINTNVTVTPTSDTAATVAVPAAVYNNVTNGNAVTIKVTNSDASTSDTVNVTAVGLPTGGSITTSGGFRIHTFTSSGTFGLTYPVAVQYLVIAGGGGSGARRHSGGGGAGGYRSSVSGENSGGGASAETASVLSAGNYTVTVGAGGASSTSGSNSNSGNTNGSNSVFGSITSLGGGWGGTYNSGGNSGGCGGGSGSESGNSHSPGSGTTGQGFNGGDGSDNVGAGGGGGGGGAGTAGADGSGENGGPGGAGVSSSITGSSVTRGGGGGGGGSSNGTAGGGGNGGGGAGANGNASPNSGAANYGGGAGGGGSDGRTVPNGGSGLVVVRYAI